MKHLSITTEICVCSPEELGEETMRLVAKAKEACQGSYSPYSGFQVGVALLLADDTIVTGSNQENAAYPSGMCAERTALYHAGAVHANKTVKALAIAAHTRDGFTDLPCPPCGACRQVMLETEERQGGKPIRTILYGEKECYLIKGGAKALLPIQFGKKIMNIWK